MEKLWRLHSSRLCVGAVALLLATGACRKTVSLQGKHHDKRLVVLGIDGMDPVLTRKYMAEGRLPNVKRLAERGHFGPLATSNPPQSPVAWSSFITGLHTEDHGIFDFVHRDVEAMAPYLSTSRADEPKTLSVGSFVVPLSSPDMKLLRQGDAFWQLLEQHQVPAFVHKIPANFPPAPSTLAISSSDMGTPDLLGTYGTFQVITSGTDFKPDAVKGGIAQVAHKRGHEWHSQIDGPPSPFSNSGKPLQVPVKVAVGADGKTAVLTVDQTDVVLKQGEWSHWVPVAFNPGALAGSLHGIVQLYLKSVSPNLLLYVSPINLDPLHPAMPVSSPPEYVEKLAEVVGRFFTQGMAEDTKALSAGVLSDDEFLDQAMDVFAERMRLLDRTLADYDGGLYFFYVSSIDQVSHMFWRALEPDANEHDARYAKVIPELYEKVDAAIGRVMDKLGPDTPLVIMSDHGFTSYRYKVHLNAWLAHQGYLSLAAKPGPGPLGHIDWDNTQAYALGLNQLFVNLAGREPKGVVPAGEKATLLARLSRELLSWRHDETGERVVTRVVQPPSGQFEALAPDLLVGYNRGFRSSDESATGIVTTAEIERNTGKWSGDHCIDPAHVPGVLISSMKPTATNPSLVDFAPSILGHFGITAPKGLAGQDLWAKTPTTTTP